MEPTLRELTERLISTGASRQQVDDQCHMLYEMLKLICNSCPDLIWAKDMNGIFTHTNVMMCEKLLCCESGEPTGKNDMYFANRERALHPENPDWHTFGEGCVDSDAVVIKSRVAERFVEYGNVRGKYLRLDVHKAPIFLNGVMIGTVGSGRDITGVI